MVTKEYGLPCWPEWFSSDTAKLAMCSRELRPSLRGKVYVPQGKWRYEEEMKRLEGRNRTGAADIVRADRAYSISYFTGNLHRVRTRSPGK